MKNKFSAVILIVIMKTVVLFSEELVKNIHTISTWGESNAEYFYKDNDNLVDSIWNIAKYSQTHDLFWYSGGLLDSVKRIQDSLPGVDGNWQPYLSDVNINYYRYDNRGRVVVDSGYNLNGGKKLSSYTVYYYNDLEAKRVDTVWNNSQKGLYPRFVYNVNLDADGDPISGEKFVINDPNNSTSGHKHNANLAWKYTKIAGKKLVSSYRETDPLFYTITNFYNDKGFIIRDSSWQRNGADVINYINSYTYNEISTKTLTTPHHKINTISLKITTFTGTPLGITISSTKRGMVSGGIYDIRGCEIISIQPLAINSGVVSFSIDEVKKLSKGIYFINISIAGEIVSTRFTVK